MPLHNRGSGLRITYTVANWPADDVTYSEVVTLPGSGDPRRAYHALGGGVGDFSWPNGSAPYGFPGGTGFGNQLITDSHGSYGIRSWSITAAPGNIPGRLTVASYKTSNTDDASPDGTVDVDLGVGSWDSGDLPVETSDGTVTWRAPRLRWVPINLLGLI